MTVMAADDRRCTLGPAAALAAAVLSASVLLAEFPMATVLYCIAAVHPTSGKNGFCAIAMISMSHMHY